MRRALPVDAAVSAAIAQAAIRAVQGPLDAQAVAAWADLLDEARFQTLIQEQHVLLARPEDPMGLASLDGDTLGLLYVHPDHQGQGVARRLVEEVAALARGAGHERLNVDASLNAVPAYRSLGFEDHGLAMYLDRNGDPWPTHRMSLPL